MPCCFGERLIGNMLMYTFGFEGPSVRVVSRLSMDPRAGKSSYYPAYTIQIKATKLRTKDFKPHTKYSSPPPGTQIVGL